MLMTYNWMSLSDLWYSPMTARAAWVKSMKSVRSFTQQKQYPLIKPLPPKHPYYTLKEVSSKVVLYEAIPCLSRPVWQVHLERDGRLIVIAEFLTDRHSCKLRTAAINSLDVAVKLDVKDAVSAKKPIWAALDCATVEATVNNCSSS